MGEAGPRCAPLIPAPAHQPLATAAETRAHWPGAPSVRAARRRRHGALQEQVRRAGGAAAVSVPVPRRSHRAVPQVRALRGDLGGPAVPAVHRGPRAGPCRQRRHHTGARGLRPGVLLHLLHRCGRDGRPRGAGPCGSAQPCVCPPQ